jgi:hypothetical protein
MKITLKTVILSILVIFNLVIIFSNFTSYEGLENKSDYETSNYEINHDENKDKTKKEKFLADVEGPTEPTKDDIKYGIVGEGDIANS